MGDRARTGLQCREWSEDRRSRAVRMLWVAIYHAGARTDRRASLVYAPASADKPNKHQAPTFAPTNARILAGCGI